MLGAIRGAPTPKMPPVRKPADARVDTVLSLAAQIERQRVGCEMAGSPLYGRILAVVADDVAAGGPCRDVLAPYADAPGGDAVILRFLAGVHDLVLAGAAPALAAHYPSVGGRPGADLAATFVATVGDHRDELTEAMTRSVQTNEPGRAVALLAGYLRLAELGLPLRILELGASGGLNLWFDRYRYEADGLAFGPDDAPLRFVDPYRGRAPRLDLDLTVESRRGCDLDPIDVRSDAGRRRLRSLVWPDQPDRRDRLDRAIATVAPLDPMIDRADAVTWLRDHLEPTPGTCTVVVHSIMLQYLAPDARRDLVDVVDQAGRRATPDAPVAWLRMEPGGDVAETRLTVWPGAVPRSVATSAYHGPPVALVGAT